MSNMSTASAPMSESREKSLLAPYRIALVVMWVVTTAAIVVMLLNDVRSTGQYKEVRYVLQVSYVAALLWYLGRSGPSVNRLPEIRPQVFPRWKFGAWIPVLVIALLFALTLVSADGAPILSLLMILVSVPILLAWRK